ncbi:MAG: RNA polymerase subunit sigma-70 [Acidimicrobiales bacterium]
MTSVLLDRARGGDQDAFAALTETYRRELHVHCYRMLGSVTDADDLLQETMTAAWRGLESFAGRSSLRAWLYRIATNRCLNAIRDAKRRPPPAPVPPFEPPEPSRRGELTWLQPYPDAWLDQLPERPAGPGERYQTRETVELAFIAALQRLPPRQTAAVVLCDVLAFSTAEVASMLSVTPAAVKGLLQRGRIALDRERPAAGTATPRPSSPAEHHLARRFAHAFATDDVAGVVALLTDDAWLAMPPAPHEYHGPDAISAFLRASATSRRGSHFELRATRANNRPAFTSALAGEPTGVLVLTLHRNQISNITHFLDPRLPSLIDLETPTNSTLTPSRWGSPC